MSQTQRIELHRTTRLSITRLSIDWHPWSRYNLRRNPFGELTQQERVALAVVDRSAIGQHLSRQSAVQLVGDCGRGKTTRMLAIAAQYPEASYVYLPEDQPCPPIPEGEPILIDEAQRLPRRVWGHLLSTGVPVVLATHRDLTPVMRRFQYRCHTLEVGNENTPELIYELIRRRIEASRLCDGPVPVFSIDDARYLVQKFGTNIRQMEAHLYEQVQTQVVGHGEMRFVD